MSFGSEEQKAEVMAALFKEWKAGQEGQNVDGDSGQQTPGKLCSEGTAIGDSSGSFLMEKGEGLSAASGGIGQVDLEGSDSSNVE